MPKNNPKPSRGKKIELHEGSVGLPPVKNKIKPPRMKLPKKD